MKFDLNYLIFFFARVIAIAIRPLTLICLVQMGFSTEADSISLVLLIISSLLIFYGLPAHLDFYRQYFSQNSNTEDSVPLLQLYINGIIGHTLFITPIIFVLLMNTGYTAYFTVLIGLILIFEKLFDEILRFKLFDKQYIFWSAITLAKFIVPIALFLGHIWINEGSDENTYINYNFFIYASILALLLTIYYWSGALQVVSVITPRLLVGSTYNHWRSKVSSFIYLTISPLVLTFDKWYVSTQNLIGGLSSLLIISQIGSLVFFFSSMIFVQNRRARLTNFNINIKELLQGYKMLSAIIFFFITLNLVFFVFPSLNSGANVERVDGVVIAVIGYFCIFSLGEPVFENVFWNESSFRLIMIDFLILIFCTILGYVKHLYSPLVSISWLTLVFFIIKISVYLVMINLRQKKRVVTGSVL